MKEWSTLSSEDALLVLDSSMQGLSDEEAMRRLEEHGPNTLNFAKATPGWLIFLKQFKSPMIMLLLGAAVVTALLRDWVDSGAIMVALLLNAIIGWWQESKAQAEVRALATSNIGRSQVKRNGQLLDLVSTDIVPGDLVQLQSGDKVPADLRLLEADQLQVDESMLTGENLTVNKTTATILTQRSIGDQFNMAFSGTLIASGRGLGVAVGTGAHTELGRINELVQAQAPETPLQKLIHAFEIRLGAIVLTVAVLMFFYGFFTSDNLVQVFTTAVTLLVAVMPEALPVVLTVALAVGVARMAKNNAVVRSLHSVETLGSVTIIASDKTGTLTQNLLTVTRLWTSRDGHLALSKLAPHILSENVKQTLIAGALGNEATPSDNALAGFFGDAVDVAMAAAACRLDVLRPEDIAKQPLAFTPYEPALGYSQMLRKNGEELVVYLKGAPDLVLNMCTSMLGPDGTLVPLDEALITEANIHLADSGLRVLATAKRVLTRSQGERENYTIPEPEELVFLGLEGMEDPPRAEVAESIAACRDAGIDVMMVTGDHPVTAKAIAAQLGIRVGSDPITGVELAELDEAQLSQRLRETSIVARVTPADKLRIVQNLQRQGHTVAVTGDGVNDAPALKAASVGVAMGKSGTEVAREASDIVLVDDNFSTIVGAVRQGRVTFSSIRKASFFLISNGMAMLVAMPLSLILGLPQLFLPIQMLWLNIVIDGVQDVALALEPAEGDELKRKPRNKKEGLLNSTMWLRTAVSGLWMATLVLLIFTWALEQGMTETHSRTLALTLMVTLCFFLVGNAKTESRSIFTVNPLNNKFLFISSAFALLIHFLATIWAPTQWLLSLEPLSFTEWFWCFVLGSSILIIVELEKLVRRQFSKRLRSKTDLR